MLPESTTTTVESTTNDSADDHHLGGRSGAGLRTTVVASTTTFVATASRALPNTRGGAEAARTGAIGLLVVGLGLFVVTRVRRAQPSGT